MDSDDLTSRICKLKFYILEKTEAPSGLAEHLKHLVQEE